MARPASSLLHSERPGGTSGTTGTRDAIVDPTPGYFLRGGTDNILEAALRLLEGRGPIAPAR